MLLFGYEIFDHTDSYACISFIRLTDITEEITSISFAYVWNEYIERNREMIITLIKKDNPFYYRIISINESKRQEEMNQELENTLLQFMRFVQKQDDFYWKYQRNSLWRKLTKKDMRLRQKANKAWDEIYHNTFNYNHYPELIKKGLN